MSLIPPPFGVTSAQASNPCNCHAPPQPPCLCFRPALDGGRGFVDVDGVGAHLDGQRNLADHVAGVGTDDAAAQDLAVAVCLRRIIKQQFGEALIAAIGNRATGRIPGEQAFLTLTPCALCLVPWPGPGLRSGRLRRFPGRYRPRSGSRGRCGRCGRRMPSPRPLQ